MSLMSQCGDCDKECIHFELDIWPADNTGNKTQNFNSSDYMIIAHRLTNKASQKDHVATNLTIKSKIPDILEPPKTDLNISGEYTCDMSNGIYLYTDENYTELDQIITTVSCG